MGYIFESEIEMIMNSVRARTIGEAETFRLRDILASDIHPAIKAYFKSRVEQLLQNERQEEARSKKFPYSLPEVVRLQEQIDLLLVHNYAFGQHDFELMLDHAVHFQFNFLCRPQWTLLNFIFENQRRRATSEIRKKLKYCVDYEYYGEIIKRFIDDRGLAELTYEEFSSLLEKIDREIVGSHSSVELALMTRPMLRFIEAALPAPAARLEEASIPINAVIVFFEDKKLEEIKERLEAERDRDGLSHITLHYLADVIEKVRTGNDEACVTFPQLQPDGEQAPSEEIPREESKPTPVAAQPADTAQVSHGPVLVFSDFEELEASGVSSAPAGDRPESEQLHKQGESLDYSDLHSIFTPAEQRLFTRKIFRKDEVSFREALDELNRISDWRDVAKYLETIFVVNDIDPFSEEAILFTDKIQSRYLPTVGDAPTG